MKRIIIMLLVLFSSIYIYANDENIFSDIPGSYAIYHDLRFDEETIIGLCYVGNNSILARTYEPKTENEFIFLLSFTIQEEEIDIEKNLKILSGDMNSSENTKRMIPMIMNWATNWYKSKALITEKGRYSFSSDDEYNYTSWIPVFQIETIGKNNKFNVFTIGKIKDFNDERFFNIKSIPETINADSYKIKKGKNVDVIIDGLKVQLDSNWKTSDERVYRLEKETPQDAIFMIETFNYKQRGLSSLKQLANLILIANQNIILLTDGSTIDFKNNSYFITIRMYDPLQKKITIQQTQLIERNDGYVSTATLACYETLYSKNKKYFDKILH